MTDKSKSIQAIELARRVLESAYGNLGLLKFNIETLEPINGAVDEESKNWKLICTFYQTLGSREPSRYEIIIDLENNTVAIKHLTAGSQEVKTFEVVPKEEKKE
ncbi:MAG: hypothetical protein KJI70_00795 [Patescibacteria group bacterium]|nr:hypothetical protein [Patescibacteria group bacterium]